MARYLEKARKKGRVRPAGGTAAHTFLSLMVTGSRELRRQGIPEKAEKLAHEHLDTYGRAMGKG